MFHMFHMNVYKNVSLDIQGSKIMEGLQLRFQTDIKINTYTTEYSMISKQFHHEREGELSGNSLFLMVENALK